MNNGGWGLRIMLIFSTVLLLFFFISVYLFSTIFQNRSLKKNNRESLKYINIENKLFNSARFYINEKYPSIKENIEITIKLDNLIANNYIAPIRDPYDNQICDGYVIFKKQDHIIKYKTYLKCGTFYKTGGYENKNT